MLREEDRETFDAVHESVSKAYAKALTDSQEGTEGCCDCGCSDRTGSTASRLAGYDTEDADTAKAAASSFGCGNPLAFADVESGQTVLDLGSGAGLDLIIAAKQVGPDGRVIGVDMTDTMIEAARENARLQGHSNIEVRKGLIEELPVDPASVDWVISNCVINLSPEKERVFAEIARVLAPGGRFRISDIVVEELPPWLRQSSEAYAACIAGAIPEAEYVSGLKRAGLTDISVDHRLVYSASQIRGLVEHDLKSFGLDAGALGEVFEEVEGKVWSAYFSGSKPRVDPDGG